MSKGELQKDDLLIKGELKQIFPAFVQLLRNGCFMFISFNKALTALFIGGASGFLTKMLLTRYPMSPSKAGVYLFVTTLITCVGKELRNNYREGGSKILQNGRKMNSRFQPVLKLK